MKKEWKRFLSVALSTILMMTTIPTGPNGMQVFANEPGEQNENPNTTSGNGSSATLSGNGTSEDPYIISKDEDWGIFAQQVADENNTYDDSYYKLGNNIHITEPVGSELQPFEGVFDGAGNQLTVAIEDTTQVGTAPFRFIQDATIKNLKATGSVTGSLHAAGLVGMSLKGEDKNTFSDCYIDVNVTATVKMSYGSVTDQRTHIGGVVGNGTDSSMDFTNIVYSGILHNEASYAGGILGWCTTGNVTRVSFSNCLFIGTYSGTGWIGPIGLKGDINKLYNVSTDGNLYFVKHDGMQLIPDNYNEVFLKVEDGKIKQVYKQPEGFCKKVVCADQQIYYSKINAKFENLNKTYDVKETPSPTVKFGNTTLTEGTDYVLSYRKGEQIDTNLSDFSEIGDYSIIAEGIGDYAGTIEESFLRVRKPDGSGTEDDPYLISSSENWDDFAFMIFRGVDSDAYYKLTDDISVSSNTTIGTSDNPFRGVFDGGNKTLHVQITDTTQQGTAPFRYIEDATIKDLNVTGTVTGATHAAGLVGFSKKGNKKNTKNTIQNCVVGTDVNVSTTLNGQYHMGGVVGHGLTSVLEMKNVIYSGSMTNNGNNYAGGLVGWSDGSTLNLNECLFRGSYKSNTGEGKFHPIAVRDNNKQMTLSLEDVYYTQAPERMDDHHIAAAGTQVYSQPQEQFCKKLTFLDGSSYYRIAKDVTSGTREGYFVNEEGGAVPVPSVICDGEELSEDDYTVTYYKEGVQKNTPLDPGNYTLKISGQGNYAGSVEGYGFEVRENISLEGEGSKSDPYKIKSAEDWTTFAAQIKFGNDEGKYFELTDNIVVTDAVGVRTAPFMGSFNGNDYTLTVSMNDTSLAGTAPFRYVRNATIQDLKVTGTVKGTNYAAGLVGFTLPGNGSNLIKNCVVETDVEVLTAGDDKFHMGGVVGYGSTAVLDMENVVYSGDLSNNGESVAGGLLGWSDGSTLNLKNCIFKGSYTSQDEEGAFHPIAAKDANATMITSADGVYNTVQAVRIDKKNVAVEGKMVSATPTEGFCKKLTFRDNSTYYYEGSTVIGDEKMIFYAPAGSEPEIPVTFDSVLLTKDKDYTVSFQKDEETVTLPLTAGVYTVAITGTGDYTGSKVSGSFELRHCLGGGDGTEESPYKIASADDWNVFAKQISYGKDADKYFELTEDIEVTQMVGSDANPFRGTFDGNGKTLSVSVNDVEHQGTAPFRYIQDATIKNVKATGSVTGTNHAAGLVGVIKKGDGKSTISDCYIDVDVTATVGELTHIGGVVGDGTTSNMEFKNIVYSGDLKNAGCYAGGILGWCTTGSITRVSFSNCLFTGTYEGTGWVGPIGLKANQNPLNHVTTDGNLYFLKHDGMKLIPDNYNEVFLRVEAGKIKQVYTEPQEEFCEKVQLVDGNWYYLKKNATIGNLASPYYIVKDTVTSVIPEVTVDGKTLEYGTDYQVTYKKGDEVATPDEKGTYTAVVSGIGSYAGLAGTTEFEVRYITAGEGTEEDPYHITSAEDWEIFADMISYGEGADAFYELTRDIEVTRKVGNSGKFFMGNFDGKNHTIRVRIEDTANKGTAPFGYIKGATIKNLKAAGRVVGTTHAAGLVGYAMDTVSDINTIENCRISVDVSANQSHIGGVIGHGKSSTIYMRNVCFDGTLSNGNSFAGGLLGWTDGGTNVTANFERCFFKGAYKGTGHFHPIALKNGGAKFSVNDDELYYLGKPISVEEKYNAAQNAGIQAYQELPENAPFLKITDVLNEGEYYILKQTEVTDVEASYTYTGQKITITPAVTFDGTLLTAGEDYTYTILCNGEESIVKEPGDYELVIEGEGEYFGTKTVTFKVDIEGDGTESAPFLIRSAEDWDILATQIANGRNADKYYMLTDDITVSTMVGTSEKLFKGTFDGNGHTLTFQYTADGKRGVGTFANVNGATIKNLRITGTIETNDIYAGGLIGSSEGNTLIENCISEITLKSTVKDDGALGGFVAYIKSGKTTFKGCCFAGRLLGPDSDQNGCFVGYSNQSASVENCISWPKEITVKNGELFSFVRTGGGSVTYSNSYYCDVDGRSGAAKPGFEEPVIDEINDCLTVWDRTLYYPVSVEIGKTVFESPEEAAEITPSVKIAGKTIAPENYHLTLDAEPVTIPFSLPQKGDYTLRLTADDYTGAKDFRLYVTQPLTQDADGNWLIYDAADWSVFAAQINGGNTFSGQTVKLMNSITVDMMVGGADTDTAFAGTLDGNGKTITVNFTADEERSGVFRSVNGATIKDLHVTGRITTSKKFAGSIAGYVYGNTTLSGCVSGVEIICETSGDGTHGGFVGCLYDTAGLTFENCMFKGKLLGKSSNNNGGFLGYCRNKGSRSVIYTGCFFAPAQITMSASGSATFNRHAADAASDNSIFTGSYYVTAYGDKQSAKQAFEGTDREKAIQFVDNGGSVKYVTLFDGSAYLISGDVTIDAGNEFATNDPSQIDPKPVVTFDGEPLRLGKDFAVEVTKKGTEEIVSDYAYDEAYTMTVTGIENYYFKKSTDVYVTPPLSGKGTAEEPYLITSAADWSIFADQISKGMNIDKCFKLTEDISVTEMAGDNNHPFKGVLDGDQRTITFEHTASFSNTGLFCKIQNATIRNLVLRGKITTGYQFAASVAARNYGSSMLENVISYMTIESTFTTKKDGTHGGLVGVNDPAGALKLVNCAFKGSLLGENATSCGGLVAYNHNTDNSKLVFMNCLFAPQQITMSATSSATIARNTHYSFSNLYCTQYFGAQQGTPVVLTPPGEGLYTPVATPDGETAYMLCHLDALKERYVYTGSPVQLEYTLKNSANKEFDSKNVKPLITDADGNVVEAAVEPGAYYMTVVGLEDKNCYGQDPEGANFHIYPDEPGTDADGNYVINDKYDWFAFVHSVNVGKKTYEGETVLLMQDIEGIDEVVGTLETFFKGTLDGNGKTISVNISDTANEATAPFRTVEGATIKNLTVEGKVAGGIHTAGLIGYTMGGTNTIEHCVIKAAVSNPATSGLRHMGGIIGHGKSAKVVLKDSVFAGSMTNTGDYAGGLYGWCNNAADLTIENSLFCGTYSGKGLFHPIAVKLNKATMKEVVCKGAYYIQEPTLTNTSNIAIGGQKAYSECPDDQPGLKKAITFANGQTCYITPENAIEDVDAYYVLEGDEPVLVTPSVTFDGKALEKDTDYELLLDESPVSASEVTISDLGRHTLTIRGIHENGYYGSLEKSFTVVGNELKQDDNGCYLIESASDWETLAYAVEHRPETVYNQVFILTQDITVTRTVGTQTHAFCGIVQGRGHTVTLDLESTGDNFGLFSYVTEDSSFVDLEIDGTIYADHRYIGSLIGRVTGGIASINDCRLKGTIETTANADFVGGFVGAVDSDAGISIDGCLFEGGLKGSGGALSGFIGYSADSICNLSDCLFKPAELTLSENSKVDPFLAQSSENTNVNMVRSYYTTAKGENPLGQKAHTVRVDEAITITLPEAYYLCDCSGISKYEGMGILCDGILYAAKGEQLHFSLSHEPVSGYENYRYQASAGTLAAGEGDQYTLTMEDADVVISLLKDPIPAQVPEITCQPENLALTYGYTEGNTLTVSANAPEGHTLSYQWLVGPTKNGDKKEIEGATGASYTIPAGEAADRTYYYQCVITSERSDNGEKAEISTDTAKVTIARREVTIKAGDQHKTYGLQDPELTVEITGIAEGEGKEQFAYTISREEGEDAGTYEITAAGEAEQGNYQVTYMPGSFTITQADAPVLSDISKEYYYKKDTDESIDLALLLNTAIRKQMPGGVSGECTYTVESVNGGSFADGKTPDVSADGKLTYTMKGTGETAAGSIVVKISTQNFKTTTVTVRFALVSKQIVTLSGNSVVELENDRLTYGQTLGTLTFKPAQFVDASGRSVEGTLSFETPDGVPDVLTTSAGWIFTPNAEDDYMSVHGEVPITVAPAEPAFTSDPVASGGVYAPDKTLADYEISEGETEVAGSWKWSDNTIVPTAGNNGYEAVFTPQDQTNYVPVTRQIPIEITKAEAVFEQLPAAGDITYGQTLGDAILSGGNASVAGTFAWEDTTIRPKVADSEATEYTVVFTPEDTGNYAVMKEKIKVKVLPARLTDVPQDTIKVPYETTVVGDVSLPDHWAWRSEDEAKTLRVNAIVKATAEYMGEDRGNYDNDVITVMIVRLECEHAHLLEHAIASVSANCIEPGVVGCYLCPDCGRHFIVDGDTLKELKANAWVIPATSHRIGKVDYAFGSDFASCTATAICENDASHKITETVKTTCQVVEAACEKKGSKTYTAVFETEGFVTQTRTVEIAATGHDWGDWTVTKEATEEADGLMTRVCKHDPSHQETKAIPKKQKASPSGQNDPSGQGSTPESGTKSGSTPKAGDILKTGKPDAALYIVTDADPKSAKAAYTQDPSADTPAKVVIPKSVTIDGVTYAVTAIADKAFKNNKKVKSIVIPDTVEQIGDNAFEGCKELTTVTIPKKCKKVGKNLFKKCRKLKKIIIKSKKLTLKSVRKKAFKGVGKKVVVKVPKTKKKAYRRLLRKRGLSRKVKVK